MAVPHPEARLQIHQGPLSRLEKEPRMAADRLRACQSLPTSQASGPHRGVVFPKAGKRPSERQNATTQAPFIGRFTTWTKVGSSGKRTHPFVFEIQRLLQRFPKSETVRSGIRYSLPSFRLRGDLRR